MSSLYFLPDPYKILYIECGIAPSRLAISISRESCFAEMYQVPKYLCFRVNCTFHFRKDYNSRTRFVFYHVITQIASGRE